MFDNQAKKQVKKKTIQETNTASRQKSERKACKHTKRCETRTKSPNACKFARQNQNQKKIKFNIACAAQLSPSPISKTPKIPCIAGSFAIHSSTLQISIPFPWGTYHRQKVVRQWMSCIRSFHKPSHWFRRWNHIPFLIFDLLVTKHGDKGGVHAFSNLFSQSTSAIDAEGGG